MIKSELMTLWNVESWTVEPHGVYFVARQLVTDGVANHEDHTIETRVKNLVEDTVKTQVENVEQAFNSLNISCSGYTEDEMLSLTFWPQLYAKLDELDRVAQKIIQKEMPPDESVVLTLTDIMLDKSGCYDAFALGYDIGESPAGHLYVLVSFDENFTAQQDVIYETL
ncbi:MAG: hypothetical protein E7K16_03965 [Veillonella dispar]|nr:hypothetical protein [Veillonella dispar]